MTDRVDAKAVMERWASRRFEWPAMGELWIALRQTLADVEALEKLRSSAQAFVDAPTKFGIRHQAYMQLRKMLAALVIGALAR